MAAGPPSPAVPHPRVLAEDGAGDHRAVSWTGAGAACAGVSAVPGACPSSCTRGDTRGPRRRWWRGSPLLPASPLWGWPCPPCVRCAGDRGQGTSGAIPWPHPPAMGCAWGASGGCGPPRDIAVVVTGGLGSVWHSHKAFPSCHPLARSLHHLTCPTPEQRAF